MGTMKRLLALPLLTLVFYACAAASGGGSGGSSSVITAEEIEPLTVTTAYEVVQRLRPQWLNRRSTPTMANPDGAEPVVYLDGMRAGDLDELRRIRAERVTRMEYMRPSDATSRFGTNHTGGAILVTTR